MQQRLKWQYYNHAVVPATAPHDTADVTAMQNEGFWRSFDGYPLFARWTSDFDCREETGWWYVIKDTPFDFMQIKSKNRQKPRKGIKNFDILIIDPTEYAEELYQVQTEALASYPTTCRPALEHDKFVKSLSDRHKGITFAAFSKEDNSMAGYAYVIKHDGYVWASVLKAKPSQEKKQVNAALVYSVLEHFKQDLAEGAYIIAGERNILHKTNCQDYMEKTFGFRRAYCRLHMQYRPGIKQLVSFFYPIRGLVKYLVKIKPFCMLNSVLKMEEIARKDEKPCLMKNV